MKRTLNAWGTFLNFVSIIILGAAVMLLISYDNWKATFILGFIFLFIQDLLMSGGLDIENKYNRKEALSEILKKKEVI